MKPTSLARRRVAVPSVLALAVLATGCPSETATPPCATAAANVRQCRDDAGCIESRDEVLDDAGHTIAVPIELGCPADTVCNFGAYADAAVQGPCPEPSGQCVNIAAPDGAALRVECRDQPDAGPECYSATDYFADGGSYSFSVNC